MAWQTSTRRRRLPPDWPAIRAASSAATTASATGIGALDALLATGTQPAEAVRIAAEIAINRDRCSASPVQVEHLSPVIKEASR